MGTFTALSVVLLGTADALVEFCDGVLQEVHAEDAVVVVEVRHRLVEAVLPGVSRLAVVKCQHHGVHVVKPDVHKLKCV